MNTHHLKKYLVTNFKKFFGALLVFGLLFSSIPAPAFAIIYQPGATLNPACLPTDTNCGVEAPFAQNGNAFNALATLGVTDNNALRFITNNAEVMRILANGNVGIGTASPSSRFAVSTSAVTSTTYTTAVSTTALTSDTNFVSSTLRQHFASTTITDTGANGIAKVRLTFNASTGTTTVSKAYIGIAATASSSDPFDFASAPTQITFNGSVSTTIASSSTAVSDTMNVTIPNGSNILVSVFTSSGGWKSKALEAGKQGYSKAGDDAATVDATGYTTATSTYAISLIEEGTDSTTAASEIFNVSTNGGVNIGSAAAGGSILLTQGTTATSSVLGLATGGSRMRLTAGQTDTQDNNQGANVDLHSVASGGALDLVAGRNGSITFWTSPTGTSAVGRATLDQNGLLSLLNGLSVTGTSTVTGNSIVTGNLGIGTNAPTSVLHVVGTQPATVGIGTPTGTSPAAALTVAGAQGGTTNHNTTATAGNGAGLSLTAGAGGLAPFAVTNATLGAGGNISLTAGAGGGDTTFSNNKIFGAGGVLSLTGGAGGSGGAGGGSGSGGSGGNVFLAGGTAGFNGVAGNVLLAIDSGGTTRGNVGIGISTAANKLTIGVDGTAAAPAIAIGATADSDTGIFHPAADALAFSTGGAERLRVATAGIGIGIQSPSAILHVVGVQPATVTSNGGTGTAAVNGLTVVGGTGGINNVGGASTATGGLGGAISITGGTGGLANFAQTVSTHGAGGAVTIAGGNGGELATFSGTQTGGAGGSLNLAGGNGGFGNAAGGGSNVAGNGGSVYLTGGAKGTAGTTGVDGNVLLGITSGGTVRGNVGIGTNSAANTLTIGVDGTAALPALALGATADSNTGIFHPAVGSLAVSVAGAEKLRFTSTGAGIGTSAPDSALHVVGPTATGNTAGVGTAAIKGVNLVAGAGSSFTAGNINGTYIGGLGGAMNIVGGAGGALTFYNFTTGSATHGAGGSLNMTGGAGASGSEFTNIPSTGGAGGSLVFTGGAGGTVSNGGGSGSVTGGVGGNLVLVGGAGGLSAAAGNVLLAVTSGGTARGNVGIGTNAPSAPLEVKGTGTGAIIAKFTDVNTTGCTLATGGTISCSSDVSLKKNVVTMNDTLPKALALNPVIFNWKFEGDDAATHPGFIAQEVEKLFPALVSTDENGLKSLAYSNFAPILVSAMQEQFGGLQGLKFGSATDYAEVFSSTSTLDALASAKASDDLISDPIAYIRERVEQSIKIVRTLVTEKLVAVNGYFKRIFANELCLTDSGGVLVCVTGDQLKNISGSTQSISSGQAAPIESGTANVSQAPTDNTTQGENNVLTDTSEKQNNTSAAQPDQENITVNTTEQTTEPEQIIAPVEQPDLTSEQKSEVQPEPVVVEPQPSPEASAGTAATQESTPVSGE